MSIREQLPTLREPYHWGVAHSYGDTYRITIYRRISKLNKLTGGTGYVTDVTGTVPDVINLASEVAESLGLVSDGV